MKGDGGKITISQGKTTFNGKFKSFIKPILAIDIAARTAGGACRMQWMQEESGE